MSLTQKVAYNTVIQIVGKVVTTLLSLVLVASLTRYLGVSGYGQYTTIFGYLAFSGVLADFGFFWILVREIAKPDADIDKVASNILTLRSIVGVAVYGISILVAYFIPEYAGFTTGIAITALASFWMALNSTYVGIFQNRLRMDKAVITDILGRAIVVAITLFLIHRGDGINQILWAYAVGNVVNFFANAWLGRAYVRFRLRFDFDYWLELFQQAWPMGIVLVLTLLYFKIDTLMLSLMKTSYDVGIYGPPYKVLEILLLIPSIFMGNVFPIITRYLHQKDDRVHNAIQKSFDFLTLLAVPIVIGVIYIAPQIIKIVAGQEFVVAHTIPPVFGLPATSVTALQILIVAVCLSFLSNLFGYIVIALGKQAKMIRPYIIFVVFNVISNLLLIPRFSYIGAALTTVLTEVLVLYFSWKVSHEYLEIKLNLGIIWKTLVSGLIMGIFLQLCVGSLSLLFLIPLAAVVYAASLWAVGGIDKKMFVGLLGARG